MTARSKRSIRRPAGLVLTFALALSLPGVGQAHHNQCNAQGSSDPTVIDPNACPEFSPGFTVHVKYPYRNTPAAINLEVSQAPHESNMLQWEWFLPREWQFTTDLDPAQTPGGGTPASCGDIFSGNNAPRAEAVSDGNGMITQVGSTITKWGAAASGNNKVGNGMYFLNTVGNRTTLCVKFASGSNTWTFPVYLDKTEVPGTPYGWIVTVPVETIQATPWWNTAAASPPDTDDFSLVTLDLEFKQKTSGLWHRVNGTPTSVVFSRAPRDPVQTGIGTRAWTCTNGANSMALCDSTGGTKLQYPYPRDTNEGGGLAEYPFTVNLPPALNYQPYANISQAGDVLIPGTGTRFDRPVDGFGYSDGTTNLVVKWNHLATGLASGVQVVGYALGAHKIVKHQSAFTAVEEAAGRVLFQREMAPVSGLNTRSFDLTDMAENQGLGTVDGKYDLSLVTIYNATINGTEYKGYRSDGLCDGELTNQKIYDPETDTLKDDDGRGVLCPPGRPVWLAGSATTQNKQGTADWQTLVRQDPWPRRYLYSQSSQPFQVLLVDPATKSAELTVWGSVGYGNGPIQPSCAPLGGSCSDPQPATFRYMGQGRADQGASTVYRADSSLIMEPTGPAAGLIQFGTIDLEGESYDWWFVGRIGGNIPGPQQTNAGAYGVFEQYAPRGSDLDWFRPSPFPSSPAQWPTWITNTAGMSGDNSRMYPDTITNDFIGTAF